jgi:hypothetical protein
VTNWGFENDDANQGDPTQNGPKALRDAYDAMKQQNKELSDGLAAIQKDLRDAKLASTFEALGVPGAATLYQGDADPAKVTEWVTTMKNTFGGQTQGTPEATPQVPQAPALEGEALAQFQRMTEAGQMGQPLGTIEQAQANVNDATNLDALLAAMKFGR